MKKRFSFLLLVILFTGCTATYNLDISNNKIVESSDFYAEDSDFDETIDMYAYENHRAFTGSFETDSLNNVHLYGTSIINDENGDGINLKYTYNFDNFGKSSLFNSCGGNKKYINSDDSITINIDDMASCFSDVSDNHLTFLTVNIKTNLKVLENNADKVNGNVYTWFIDEENYEDKTIEIVLKKNFSINIEDNSMVMFAIILLVISIIAFSIYLVVRKWFVDRNSL